jgi:hypothetical protein
MVTMRSLSTDLSLGAQTSYAELLDMAGSAEKARFGTLQGSFHRRQIKGKTYLYFNFRDVNGRGRSAYVGPESERVQCLILEFEQSTVAQRLTALNQRAKACIALGCSGMPTKQFRIVQKLAGYGFFRAGGVLVDTHAFGLIGNMLGLCWTSSGRAMDIDFAHADPSISIALRADSEISAPDAITSLEAGLLPIREFSGRTAAQRHQLEESDLHIQFVTANAKRSRVSQTPNTGIEMESVKFTDFLLEEAVHGVAFAKSGACLINLPDPARFAVHNLVVYGERPIPERAKSIKLLMQAAALIEWHVDQQRVAHLREVWRGALARGPVWRTGAEKGRDALLEQHAALAHCLK